MVLDRFTWLVAGLFVGVATPARAGDPTAGSDSSGSSDSGGTSSGDTGDATGTDSSGTSGGFDTGDLDTSGDDTGGSNNHCSGVPAGVEITQPTDGATVPTSFTTRAVVSPRCVCDKLQGSGCWDDSPSAVALYVDTSDEPLGTIDGPGDVLFDTELAPGDHTITVEAYWGGDDGYLDLERSDMVEVFVETATSGDGTSGGGPGSDGGATMDGGDTEGGGAASEPAGGCGCTTGSTPREGGGAWFAAALLPLLGRRAASRRRRVATSAA